MLLFTETHHLPGATPPSLQGYSLVNHRPGTPCSTGRGRGGVAIYARSSLVGRVQQWHSWEGVAWIQIRGEAGPPRYVASVYLPPQRTSEQLAAFYGRLQQDVLAAQAAGGTVCIGGDLNGRTASLPDWVESEEGRTLLDRCVALPPRASCDGEVNPQGRALLGFCAATGLAIANGRLDGDQQGEWTFHSLAHAGKSLVDYFLLSGEVVGRAGNRLLVQPPTDRFDHATLRLQLAGDSQAAGAGPCPAEGLGPNPCGPEYRFVPSLLPAFVDALRGARPALEAAATAAAAATSIEQLTAACMSFDGVVTSSLDTAGMPVRQAGPARPPGWQRQACKDPLTSRLRRRRRRALSRRDFTLAVALNRQMCAAARRHKRQVKVKVKVGKSLHKLNFPVLTSSFRPLFDLPDAPSAVPPTSSEWVPGRPVPKPWRFY